jgi:hypothetical protein
MVGRACDDAGQDDEKDAGPHVRRVLTERASVTPRLFKIRPLPDFSEEDLPFLRNGCF